MVELNVKNAIFEKLKNKVKQAVYYSNNKKNTDFGIYFVKFGLY